VAGRLRRILLIALPSALITTLVLASAVELWVRSTWDARKGRPGFFLSDPVRGQRLAAGYDGWFAGVPVHINRLELRDSREYALEKQPNTFRILVLGDSVTFGHGSLYEHTYPYLLEQHLRQWQPNVDWQVWNAAVPGYNTSQELAYLLEVGARFKPDLVVVGFYNNDLFDNRPVRSATRWQRVAAGTESWVRLHLYSFEFYKRVYLTVRWRISKEKQDRLRAEHVDVEQELLAANDLSKAPEQRLTDFDRLTDDQVRGFDCVYGMKPHADAIQRMQRDPGFEPWMDAVNGFKQLARTGNFRIVFFLNDAPAICGTEPESDFFYDGGSAAEDRFYLETLGTELSAVSTYDAFMHTRPSQMPGSGGHSLGNANAVKAEVLFDFLRTRVPSSGALSRNESPRRGD
jgi:GDSL-like Lipase/Acylhydrolase family